MCFQDFHVSEHYVDIEILRFILEYLLDTSRQATELSRDGWSFPNESKVNYKITINKLLNPMLQYLKYTRWRDHL